MGFLFQKPDISYFPFTPRVLKEAKQVKERLERAMERDKSLILASQICRLIGLQLALKLR